MALVISGARVIRHDRSTSPNKFLIQGTFDGSRVGTVELSVSTGDAGLMGIDPIASLSGDPTFSITIEEEV
jgi:hypothetical protein